MILPFFENYPLIPLTHSYLPAIQRGRYYYYPHFIDEETEVQRLRSLLKGTKQVNSKAGFEPQQVSSRVHVLNHTTTLLQCPHVLCQDPDVELRPRTFCQ